MLTPVTQTMIWALAFFFASAAASSAYLTVSEIFPVELRGMVIALFFAVGTLLGAPSPRGSSDGSLIRVHGLMCFTATCWPRHFSW